MCALILILSGHAGIFKTTLVPNVRYNVLKILLRFLSAIQNRVGKCTRVVVKRFGSSH